MAQPPKPAPTPGPAPKPRVPHGHDRLAQQQAALAELSADAREALVFFNPRHGFPPFTPKAALAELRAAGLVKGAEASPRLDPQGGRRLQAIAGFGRRQGRGKSS